MKSVKVNLNRCSYILWLIFTTNPERENESPSSALDLFLKIFFVYKNQGAKKKKKIRYKKSKSLLIPFVSASQLEDWNQEAMKSRPPAQ